KSGRRLVGAIITITATFAAWRSFWYCRFWSTVKNTSKLWATISLSNSPLLLLAQPMPCTVCASWPGKCRLMILWTHSSIRMRMGQHHLLGRFQGGHGLLAGNRGESIEEHIQRIPSCQVVEKR